MKIAICGGGTGGHIFPALAVWQQIKKIEPISKVIWLGSNRLETTILPNYNIQPIDCGWYFQRWPLNPKGIIRSLKALSELFIFRNPQKIAGKYLDEFQPDIVICGGSYVCLPGSLAANERKLPVYLIEPHPILGRANNWVLPHVKIVFTAFDHLAEELKQKGVKTINHGMPMRTIPDDFSRERLLSNYNLNPNLKTILVTGGSQGAKVINDFIFSWLEHCSSGSKMMINGEEVQIIHQLGSNNIEVGNVFADTHRNINYTPIDFIPDMLQVAASSDVVVSRAGISTSGELSTLGIPVLYIPLPHSAEDHQRKIAKSEVDNNRAMMIEQDDLEFSKFNDIFNELMSPEWQQKAVKNKKLSTNAAKNIAQSMIDDFKSSTKN